MQCNVMQCNVCKCVSLYVHVYLHGHTHIYIYITSGFLVKHQPPLRLAAEKMELCLQKGAQARKYSISLGSLEYSGDLSQQMLQFSTKMEKIYRNLRELVDKKIMEEGPYEKHFQIIQEKIQWYEKAEVGFLPSYLGETCTEISKLQTVSGYPSI